MNLKNIRIKFIVSLLLLNVFQFAYAEQTAKVDNDTAIQNEILVYINQYRQQHGLSTLKMDNRIVKEAKIHSIDMAKHKIPFGHKYFGTRIDRLHAQIKNSNAGAENVAFNYKNAQDVVKNWLRSPGHKRNIDGHYDLTGIGVVRDQNGKLYFTQIFLRTGKSTKYVRRNSLPNFFHKPLFGKTAFG